MVPAACFVTSNQHIPNSANPLFILKMTPLSVPLRRSAIRYFSVASKVTTAHFRDVISGVAESRQDMWKQIDLTTRRHEELVASTTRRHDELVLTTANRHDKLVHLLYGGFATVLGGLATLFGTVVVGFIVLHQRIEQKFEKINDKLVDMNENFMKEIKECIAESNYNKWI